MGAILSEGLEVTSGDMHERSVRGQLVQIGLATEDVEQSGEANVGLSKLLHAQDTGSAAVVKEGWGLQVAGKTRCLDETRKFEDKSCDTPTAWKLAFQ